MDTLKKIAIVVGIVAGAATIVVAVVAVVTLMMNVATKDDISDLKEQMTTGFEQVSREISGLRTEVDQKTSDIRTDVRTNAQNHVNHLAKHNETGGNGKPR